MDGEEMIDGAAAHPRAAPDPSLAFAARGALAAAQPIFAYRPGTASIRLFDPNRFLAVIAVLFWPLKFVPVLLIPAVLLAALTMYKHWNDIAADLHRLLGEFSFVVHLVLSLLIINLGVRLAMGAVVRAFGGAVREFGLTFFLGMIPRFYVDRSAIARLDRRGQLWAYGTPLMVRLGFFAFGMLAWATYRSNQNWVSSLALLVSQAGLWSFVFAMVPFLGDGYGWLAIYFRQPMLRQKALVALSAKLRGRRLPPGIRPEEAPALIALAIGFIAVIVALALGVLVISGMLLIGMLQGVGAVVFLALVTAFAFWLLSVRPRLARRRQQPREVRLLQAMMMGQAAAAEPESAPTASRWRRRLVTWAGAGVALILVAFLPYSYDPAGPFEIVPSQGSEVIARTDGEVVDVLVREGDWVKAGQVLAHLSAADQRRDVGLTREELDRAQARLAELRGNSPNTSQDTVGPVRRVSAAEREEAQNEVDRLRQQLHNDEGQLDRTAIRAPAAGFVTTPNPQFLRGVWLNAGDKFLQIDDTKLVEAEIKISQDDVALIKPGVEVRLRPWSERDREIVGRVTSIAPTGLDETNNKVPSTDELIANAGTLQSAAVIRGEPAPKTADDDTSAAGVDESRPHVGMPPRRGIISRGRPAAAAVKSDNGDFIRVKASIPNADTLLRPAMTGYAKISGRQMKAWEAGLRLCNRFVTVEFWSWVP
jgi:multidrug efflux pump subunit AcrA (membrane-fusion protein)